MRWSPSSSLVYSSRRTRSRRSVERGRGGRGGRQAVRRVESRGVATWTTDRLLLLGDVVEDGDETLGANELSITDTTSEAALVPVLPESVDSGENLLATLAADHVGTVGTAKQDLVKSSSGVLLHVKVLRSDGLLVAGHAPGSATHQDELVLHDPFALGTGEAFDVEGTLKGDQELLGVVDRLVAGRTTP